jgi:hypothetical protein
MLSLPRALSACLLTGLSWAACIDAHAREVRPSEPLRVTMVSLARQATSTDGNANARLSVRSAWATDSIAQLCALTLNAQGQPVLDRGRFQILRTQFERKQGQWRVQRSDTSWLPAGASLDSVCPKSGGTLEPATQLAKQPAPDINLAIAEMERRPPTAGLPNSLPEVRTNITCPAQAETVPDTSRWQSGRVNADGRSALFKRPDQTCPLGKHLVQNDKVRFGPSKGTWTQVQYTHPITQAITVGWLPTTRVLATDTQVASGTH